MTAEYKKPKQALNAAYLKLKPSRAEIDNFKSNLVELTRKIDINESEEHAKTLVRDFLLDTYYKGLFEINVKSRNDLVIHSDKTSKSPVSVIIEAKRPSERYDFPTVSNLNVKAVHELVLYYLNERVKCSNSDIRHLIATNGYEWFIFDGNDFYKYFYCNTALLKEYGEWAAKQKDSSSTELFYRDIASKYIEKVKSVLPFTYFNIKDYEKYLRNEDKEDDVNLIPLFKLLSPEHLLKQPFSNDSNTLDKNFYFELLHIIGLEEVKEGGKKIIQRKKQPDEGSLLENTINIMKAEGSLFRLTNPDSFGITGEERYFGVALELCITWINRILFLKLLEAQLLKYFKSSEEYRFLNYGTIESFDDLEELFLEVLAVEVDKRSERIKNKYGKIPYLNSSLFELTQLESQLCTINKLKDNLSIPVIPKTVLKDRSGKKRPGKMNTLEYLFEFLDAYDFSSEGSEDILEERKTLINASVLGLIFEKINGYRDGSFFTPGFITMYMCRETVRRAVIQKFNDQFKLDTEDFGELKNFIGSPYKKDDILKYNKIINSLKICDPAVGSGHFLVSALNEIIAVKSELNILSDAEGNRLSGLSAFVENDELVTADSNTGDLFEYIPGNAESQRIQQALFREKQTIIENCLFGVDINHNSVKICRLRLWIELLKNAYYTPGSKFTELETLPNIDINIKCGNSLVSRFGLDADLSSALRKSKWNITGYRLAVQSYQNAKTKDEKRELEKLLNDIKTNFRTEISTNDPKQKKLNSLENELYEKYTGSKLIHIELSGKEKAEQEKDRKKLEAQINKLSTEITEIKESAVYRNAFEWRFEFPEVLDEKGSYIGFDVVIGNPPYFSLSKVKEQSDLFSRSGYKTYSKGADIYCLFYERGGEILKKFGLLTFITSNSWLRSIYGNLLKKYFIENLQPLALMNIEDIQVFEEATVESNIIQLQKDGKTVSFPAVNLTSDYLFGASLSDYFNKNNFQFTVPDTSEWYIGDQKAGKLKLKIEKDSKLLKDFRISINFGIKTGYNEAFIIDEKTKDELILADSKNIEIIKPILRGRDVQKYAYTFEKMYLLNTHNGLKSKKIPRIDVEKDYPVIYEYLKKFLPKVKSRYDQGDHWSNLRNCAYLDEFEKPKIVWGEISDKPKFAYDDSNFYEEATTFLMTGEKLKYILAILNSKVSEWYFHTIGTTTGMGTNRWKKYKIESLPVKEPTAEQENQLGRLVDRILSLKKTNYKADTSELEKEIDKLVYQLYGLTEGEIEIVERG